MARKPLIRVAEKLKLKTPALPPRRTPPVDPNRPTPENPGRTNVKPAGVTDPRPDGKALRCGAKLRYKNKYCHQAAGWRTPHPGIGRCSRHGGLTPIKHGRYSLIQHTRVRSLLDTLHEVDRQVLDLEPEANLLRAMVIEYVERYEEINTQLAVWYQWKLKEHRDRGGKGQPPVPPRVLNLEDAKDLIEAVSRVVERIHKIQQSGSISLDTFRRALEQMGLIVARHVEDTDVLAKIEKDWADMVVDARSPVRHDDGNDEHAALIEPKGHPRTARDRSISYQDADTDAEES